MNTPANIINIGTDLSLVKLAREIAIEHEEIETILERYHIDQETWSRIKENPRFNQLLDSEITAWQSAVNTIERTKLKSAAVVEEFLPEANARMHDPREALNHKVEMLKAMMRIAGMDRNERDSSSGEGYNITINLGADTKLQFNKQPPEPIDVTPAENLE